MIDPLLLLNDVKTFDHGKRSRYKYDGKGIPSVTELLSYIDSNGLIGWANSIGLKGIKNTDVAKQAAEYGTMVHESIELFLKNKPIPEEKITSSFLAFKKWWEGINSCHRVVVKGQEQSLISEYFAGTYDLLITIDDKPYLIDFKTSNHVGYKYFMQLAAYRHLLYTVKKVNLQGCIILQLDKGEEPKFREFTLNFSDSYHYEFIENCFRSFMGLVYTYYNTKLCNRQFADIF